MPKDIHVSLDEFIARNKGFTQDNGTISKMSKAPASWNKDARSARFVMSSEAPDRDKDIIRQDGMDIASFMKNPVALAFHNLRSWPIGKWADVEKTKSGKSKQTEGTLFFLPEGDDPDSDRMARHVAAGTIRACSVGILPKTILRRAETEEGEWPGFDIPESELVECSIVPIPAHPEALAKMAAEDPVWAKELLEDILDTWAKHPETGLLIPRADYEALHKTLNGNTSSAIVTIDAIEVKQMIADAQAESVKEHTSMLARIKALFAKAPAETVIELPKMASAETKAAAVARSKALAGRLSTEGRT